MTCFTFSNQLYLVYSTNKISHLHLNSGNGWELKLNGDFVLEQVEALLYGVGEEVGSVILEQIV